MVGWELAYADLNSQLPRGMRNWQNWKGKFLTQVNLYKASSTPSESLTFLCVKLNVAN